MARTRLPFYLPLRRSGLQRIAPPTTPSADFCAAIRLPCGARSPVAGTTAQISRGKTNHLRRTPAGCTAPVLDGHGLRGCLPARPAGSASLSVSCPSGRGFAPRFLQTLPRGRPACAGTPLRFANPSPPSGWIEDLHLRVVDHARHTDVDGRDERGHDVERRTGVSGCDGKQRLVRFERHRP